MATPKKRKGMSKTAKSSHKSRPRHRRSSPDMSRRSEFSGDEERM